MRPFPRAGAPAVAAVAVTAAVLITGCSSAPAAPKPAKPVHLTVFQPPSGVLGSASKDAAAARKALLAIAGAAAKAAAPAAGRYWVTPAVAGNFVEVGTPKNHYLVLEKVATQTWAASAASDGSPSVEQPLGVQLASAADQAAWHRAGSPAQWSDAAQDTGLADPQGYANSGRLAPLSAGPGKQVVSTVNSGGPPFAVGNELLSLAQLRALPADPATLKAMLLQVWNSGYGDAQAYLFEAMPPILRMPVTPAVRSALYQMLAGLPGMQSLGEVTDAAGQRGVAVAYTTKYTGCGGVLDLGGTGAAGFQTTFAYCTVQQILVMNPATGLPLAEELRYAKLPPGQSWSAPDGLFSYEIYTAGRWTNASPPS